MAIAARRGQRPLVFYKMEKKSDFIFYSFALNKENKRNFNNENRKNSIKIYYYVIV